MPVPKPRADEDKDEFVSRCIRFMRDEGTEQSQAIAICFQAWRERDKQDQTKDSAIE